MQPHDALFVELGLLSSAFATAGAWAMAIYHAHRAYRLRLNNLRARLAEWAVAA